MPHHCSHPSLLHRLTAVGALLLVLALVILSASPAAHDHVHAGCDHDHDHGCAVVLFAHGVWISLKPTLPGAPIPVALFSNEFYSPEEIYLITPRYRHRPERGPPLA